MDICRIESLIRYMNMPKKIGAIHAGVGVAKYKATCFDPL